MSWLQGYGWVVGLIVAVALALGRLAWWTVRRRPATLVPGAAARRQVDVTFAAAVLVTLAVGLTVVFWLLAQAEQVPAGKDRATVQADAVRTGAAIALGTGGAAYLLLAYRRQRLDEVDTRERRITELYTKAVEQLGHEKAPVRLGALYSLERLAQNNPEHRQTVIDVFCAYLRMPYSLPTRNKPDTEQAEAATAEDHQERAPQRVVGHDPAQEELQVRQTAQRILAAHLQLPPGIVSAAAQRRQPSPRRAFWPGMSLDLTGAALVDFKFQRVSVVQGRFDGATFQGNAWFNRATFEGDAEFGGATFKGAAWFVGATFQGDAWFNRATFQGLAAFDEATFQGSAWFRRATFKGRVLFDGVTFEGDAWFNATFQGHAWFNANFQRRAGFGRATFEDGAEFHGTTFEGPAEFGRVTFQSDAGFGRVTFQGDAEFGRAIFEDVAGFGGVTFESGAWFGGVTFSSGNRGVGVAGARVLHVDDPAFNKRRKWPDGWTVRPDPARPSHGTLVPAEQAKEPEPAGPPSDPTGRNG